MQEQPKDIVNYVIQQNSEHVELLRNRFHHLNQTLSAFSHTLALLEKQQSSIIEKIENNEIKIEKLKENYDKRLLGIETDYLTYKAITRLLGRLWPLWTGIALLILTIDAEEIIKIFRLMK